MQLEPSAAQALAELVVSVADAVYAVDSGGRVQYANPAALAILGYDDARELIGRPSHATIHHTRPDGRPFPEADCPLLRPRATGEVVRNEEDWFIRRDGSFVPVAYSSAPIDGPEGRGAVVVFRDISALREAQSAAREAAAQRARAEELQASRARILAATDAERRRFGRDLHDGAQQRLVLALFALKQGQQGDAAEHVQAALGELRELAAGLHPAVLSHRGLAAAVESLTARSPLPVDLRIPAERFDPALEAAAYFVIAESLTNVAKHAEAGGASVTVTVRAAVVVIEVADDGVGGADPLRGSGLRGLGDRVAALGGTLAVRSPAGAGTALRAELPLSPPAAA